MQKEQHFDSTTGSTCLQLVEISKAHAKQRSGRAGRVQAGKCYRMFSKHEFERMAEFSTPEMLRVSLVEICLKAKTVAGDLSIGEFLGMALTPPDIGQIRESVNFLQKIDALDDAENMTSIGSQLANMPVDCQYGKMILTAILLGCVNPIISMVSMMSVNNINITKTAKNTERPQQPQPEPNRAHPMSDHRSLIELYNEWATSGRQGQLCENAGISQSAMQMVKSIRQQLKNHLSRENLVRSWDIANMFELNWHCVKAAVTSGLHTNTAYINDEEKIESNNHEPLKLHVSSKCRHADMTRGSIILYNSRVQTKAPIDASRAISLVSPINIAIFGETMQRIYEHPLTTTLKISVSVIRNLFASRLHSRRR